MAKGRRGQIEGHREVIRLLQLQLLQKDIQKAVYGIRMLPLGVCELRDAVECAGQDTVPIDQ